MKKICILIAVLCAAFEIRAKENEMNRLIITETAKYNSLLIGALDNQHSLAI